MPELLAVSFWYQIMREQLYCHGFEMRKHFLDIFKKIQVFAANMIVMNEKIILIKSFKTVVTTR